VIPGETLRQTDDGEIVWRRSASQVAEAHDRGRARWINCDALLGELAVAWKISAQRKHSGQMERIEQRRGSRRKVTPE